MLTAKRAFALSAASAPLLPQPDSLAPLWGKLGAKPREGDLVMIAGRPGHQKSGFAMFWVAEMKLPTLYVSGDMTAFEATSRLASMRTGETAEEVEAGWLTDEGRQRYGDALRDVDFTFSFGSPITWAAIEAELDAYVELHNVLPKILVIDNLMDMEGGESDYTAQTAIMQDLTGLSRETGITVIVLHHATDKGARAQSDPGLPPPRGEIKNGLSEKPQLIFTVAFYDELAPARLRVACVKQRSGKADASAATWVELRAFPEVTRFEPWNPLAR